MRSRPGTCGVGDGALLVLDGEVEGAGVLVEGLKTVRARGAEAGYGEGGGIRCSVPGEDAPAKGGSEMGEEEDDGYGEGRHVSEERLGEGEEEELGHGRLPSFCKSALKLGTVDGRGCWGFQHSKGFSFINHARHNLHS